MAAVAVLGVRSTLQLQRAVRQDYAYRLPLQPPTFLDANASSAGGQLRYIAFTQDGYHLLSADQDERLVDLSSVDELSFAANSSDVWVEKARSPRSQIVSVQEPGRVFVDDAREPMLSADGRSIALIRDDHGRGQLMLRTDFRSGNAIETALTPAALNVYEASFRSKDEYAFSAVENGSAPQIYLTDATHANGPLALGQSRFPALSPDGAWMAYSHLDRGVWNLWLRDQRSGATHRIADIPCNQIQPAWEDDSKTLLYGADCGRSLWFTAISRRVVIP
jgi:Tol biopolymer transport system component